MGEQISFTFIPPSFGKKKELCSLNNLSRWYRFQKTKIKDEFQAMLGDWFLPPWGDNPYMKAEISYTILRKNGLKFDSDNLTYTYKMFQDFLVKQGYLIDDNHVKVTLNPTQLNVEGSMETSVLVEIKLIERYIMTLENLKDQAEQLDHEMQVFFSEKRTLAGSARIRAILGQIKLATPQLRRDLVSADEKKK